MVAHIHVELADVIHQGVEGEHQGGEGEHQGGEGEDPGGVGGPLLHDLRVLFKMRHCLFGLMEGISFQIPMFSILQIQAFKIVPLTVILEKK